MHDQAEPSQTAELPKADAKPPESFQRMRGLQQYRRQQGHHIPQEDQATPSDVENPDQVPQQNKLFPAAVEERANFHALDTYFTRELGLRDSTIPAIAPVIDPASTEKTIETSKTHRNAPEQLVEPRVKRQVQQETDGDKVFTFPQQPRSPKNKQQGRQLPNRLRPASPYQDFVAGLSYKDFKYLLQESNAAIQVLLLQNATCKIRTQILQQMPRNERTTMLRTLAENTQDLSGDDYLKAFHWLSRKVQNPYSQPDMSVDDRYPPINGIKALSMILDALPPDKEKQILHSVSQDDEQLAEWLQRDRGSEKQRKILHQVCLEISNLELALLFSIPHFGRLLRHLLNGEKKRDLLHSSIDLAQMPSEKRQRIEEKLFTDFPILQECSPLN